MEPSNNTSNEDEVLTSRARSLSKIRYLARAFENSVTGMTLLDCEGRWIEMNPAFCKMLGYSREQLIGTTPNPHTHPDDLPHCLEQRSQLLNGEISGFQTEQRYLRADGSELWVRVEALMILGQNGDPDLIMAQFKDISSRRQMRQALEDSEARLQAIIRSMGEGVMAYDAKGNLIFSNDRAAEIFAMTPAELTQASDLDEHWHITHADGRRFIVDEYPAIITLKTGKPQREAILRVKKADGRFVWIEVNTEPVRIKYGSDMIAVVATISDITERRQTQAALEDSEERLSLALDAARLGMWDWDLEKGEIQLNSTANSILNHTDPEFESSFDNVFAMIHEEDQPRALDALNQHLHGESSQFNVDVRMYRVSEGHIWVNLLGRITKSSEQGKPVRLSGILMDIDDRKRMIDQLEKLATTDSLTELHNRRFGSEALEQAALQSNRHQQPFGLILMDVDHFKQINDQFGHDAGDKALKNIARLLKQRTRKTDTAIRWGGEEFAILLNGTNLAGTEKVAKDLLEGFQSLTRPDGQTMSISIGVTEYRPKESINQLLKRADHLMYEAKRAGRGQLVSGA